MGSSTPQAPKGTVKPKGPKRIPKRTQRVVFEMVRGKPLNLTFGGTIANAGCPPSGIRTYGDGRI